MKTSEILTSAYKHLWNGDIDTKQYGHAWNVCAAVRDTHEKYCKSPATWKTSYEKFDAHMDSIIWDKTNASYYQEHLRRLGVSRSLTKNHEWMQLRRRELLCNIISHFEALGD